MIRVQEGTADVQLDSTEDRQLSGALAVSYRANDLLLAAVRVLDAIGDTRADAVRRLLR